MCIAQCSDAIPLIDACYTPRASREKLTTCVCKYGSLREFTQCIDCLKFVQNPLAIVYNDIRLGCVASQPRIVERGTNVLTLILQGTPFQTILYTNPHLGNPMLAYGGVWWSGAVKAVGYAVLFGAAMSFAFV